MVTLSFGGTSRGWRTGLTGISWNWAQGNAKSYTWRGRNSTPIPEAWGHTSWKAALQKRLWGLWWTPSGTWATSVLLWQRWPAVPWDNGGDPFSVLWWEHTYSTASKSGLPSTRGVQAWWIKPSEEPQRCWRGWSLYDTSRGLFSLEMARLKGDFINVCNAQ